MHITIRSAFQFFQIQNININKTFCAGAIIRNQIKFTSSHAINTTPATTPKAQTKRILKKKSHSQITQNISQVIAYSTADTYDLSKLKEAFLNEGTYDVIHVDDEKTGANNEEVVCLKAKYNLVKDSDSRLIYLFEDGTCVFWNIHDLAERNNIFNLLNKHTVNSYDEELINNEIEILTYSIDHGNATAVNNTTTTTTSDELNRKDTYLRKNHIYLKATSSDPIENEKTFILEKFTFSDAIALSVKLGILENKLENFIESIEHIGEDMKAGRKFRMTSDDVLQKTGELMAMRHLINLRFDLLNTPDWYWDREKLEMLYLSTISFLDIGKRTRVYNEKLNHCIDLMRLLESNLNEKKHTRLEWCIIILIMVEAFFGILSFFTKSSAH